MKVRSTTFSRPATSGMCSLRPMDFGGARCSGGRRAWAMRVGFSVTMLVCLLATSHDLASNAQTIPGDVTHVAVGTARFGDRWSSFRLVITGHCSQEHCFSRGRIEWVKGAIPGKSTILKTVPIQELESTLVVQSVEFHPMQPPKPASFEIHAANTYTEEGGTIVLLITGVGTYKAILTGDASRPSPSNTERR